MAFDMRTEDEEEYTAIDEFQRGGCSCTIGPNNTPCCQRFPVSHYQEYRAQCLEMSKEQLDMVIIGQMEALTYSTNQCIRSITQRHSPQERQRQLVMFLHQHHRVCQKMFHFLHAVGKKRMEALRQHYRAYGIAPRVHGNSGRSPHNTFTLSEVKNATNFIINFTEANGVILPGRVPGYKRSDLQLLPSSTTKRQVWLQYSQASRLSSIRAAGYSAFCTIWRKLLPQVLITKPLTDLCAVCHRNSSLLVKSSNCPEEEKLQVQ